MNKNARLLLLAFVSMPQVNLLDLMTRFAYV